MNNEFNHYQLIKGNIQADTLFVPGRKLANLPITTPFTFPIIGSKVMLAKDKMGWWNPVGGAFRNQRKLAGGSY